MKEVCPHCNVKYGFSFEHRINSNNLEHEHPVKTLCPGCGQMVRFFILNPSSAAGVTWDGEIWMHPAPRTRMPLAVGGRLPPRLVADYRSAIESYQHGLWRGAAQQARIVLEGVVKHLLADHETSTRRNALASELQRLAETIDLARPIIDVSDVMREGGNVASHFDDLVDVDSEMATQMLDLLDAFVDYLVLLPGRVETLRERLS